MDDLANRIACHFVANDDISLEEGRSWCREVLSAQGPFPLAEKSLVYLVIKWRGEQVEFQGIFSTEERAISACRDADHVFMVFTLDEELPQPPQDFAEAVCPVLNLIKRTGSSSWVHWREKEKQPDA